jgi:hypothetical protein
VKFGVIKLAGVATAGRGRRPMTIIRRATHEAGHLVVLTVSVVTSRRPTAT